MFLHRMNVADLERRPAVYVISCRNKKGKPVSIARSGDTDKKGRVYIGECGDLRDRLGNFRKIIFDDYKTLQGHSAANRYVRIKKYQELFPADLLWVEWEFLKSKTLAQKKEKDMLRDYIEQFGDLPPFNKEMPFGNLSKDWGDPLAFPHPSSD